MHTPDLGVSIHCTDAPTEVERGAVDAGLDAYNQAAAPLGEVRPLAALAHDDQGRIVGGAVGRTWGACCELEQLWVDEHRRKAGLGSRLLRAFEDRARQRACRVFYLTTLSYQAPDFYRRHGYNAISQINGYGPGISKFLMHKVDLAAGAATTAGRPEPAESPAQTLTLQLFDVADEAVRQQIVAPLAQHNLDRAGPGHGRPLVITLNDASGTVVGGLWGYSGYQWLFTQLLAVPSGHRGRGLGRALMAMAENEARARGCTGSWLDTFEFQARGFYERIGYTCFAELPNYPQGHARYFMRKSLDGSADLHPSPK